MSQHPLLFEVNTRVWLRELSAAAGKPVTLDAVPEECLEGWRNWGFTHIWLMGVWRTGPRARESTLRSASLRAELSRSHPGLREDELVASPYAISSYTVCPKLGGNRALLRFKQKLNHRGLKLILDFVPNHLGLDHPWVQEHPDRFVQTDRPAAGFFSVQTKAGERWLAHGRDPYFPPWTDTVQLDYRSPQTRAAMIALLSEAGNLCDGVRCDMAMLVLNAVFNRTWPAMQPHSTPPDREFWAEAIASVRARRKDFTFLAEAYWGLEPDLQALGFDFTYEKTLYDLLVTRDWPGAVKRVHSLPSQRLEKSTHFLENHDEPRIAGLLTPCEHKAAALLALALPGMRLLHQGQMEGVITKTPLQLLAWPLERDPEIYAFYDHLLRRLGHTAIGKGNWHLAKIDPAADGDDSWESVVAIGWTEATTMDLAVINLSARPSRCMLALDSVFRKDPTEELGLGPPLGKVCWREGRFSLELAPHAAHILQWTGKSA